MIDLNEYNRLKKAVDDKQREANKAAGALEQTVAQIKSEFGCASFADAKRKLAELEEQEKQAESEYNKALKKFKNDFSRHLELEPD